MSTKSFKGNSPGLTHCGGYSLASGFSKLIGGFAGVGSSIRLLYIGNDELIEAQIVLLPDNLNAFIDLQDFHVVLEAETQKNDYKPVGVSNSGLTISLWAWDHP